MADIIVIMKCYLQEMQIIIRMETLAMAPVKVFFFFVFFSSEKY